MSLGYAFRGAARADVDAAHTFYEGRQPGLGDDFLRELNQFVALVCANPHMYAPIRGGVHAGKLNRFPHVVYYRVRPTQILVIAVLHGRAHPRRWRRRR